MSSQMSFSIPIFFDFIEVDNTLYVDGSVRMNIPFITSPDDESTLIIVVVELLYILDGRK